MLIMDNMDERLCGNEFKEDGETGEFDSSDNRRVGISRSSVSANGVSFGFWEVDAAVGEAVFGFRAWWLPDRVRQLPDLPLQYIEELSDRQLLYRVRNHVTYCAASGTLS